MKNEKELNYLDSLEEYEGETVREKLENYFKNNKENVITGDDGNREFFLVV